MELVEMTRTLVLAGGLASRHAALSVVVITSFFAPQVIAFSDRVRYLVIFVVAWALTLHRWFRLLIQRHFLPEVLVLLRPGKRATEASTTSAPDRQDSAQRERKSVTLLG